MRYHVQAIKVKCRVFKPDSQAAKAKVLASFYGVVLAVRQGLRQRLKQRLAGGKAKFLPYERPAAVGRNGRILPKNKG
jgi:hypothetical protein